MLIWLALDNEFSYDIHIKSLMIQLMELTIVLSGTINKRLISWQSFYSQSWLVDQLTSKSEHTLLRITTNHCSSNHSYRLLSFNSFQNFYSKNITATTVAVRIIRHCRNNRYLLLNIKYWHLNQDINNPRVSAFPNDQDLTRW